MRDAETSPLVKFVLALPDVMPCHICRQHFKELCDNKQVALTCASHAKSMVNTDLAKSASNPAAWVSILHDYVNTALGKVTTKFTQRPPLPSTTDAFFTVCVAFVGAVDLLWMETRTPLADLKLQIRTREVVNALDNLASALDKPPLRLVASLGQPLVPHIAYYFKRPAADAIALLDALRVDH